MTIFKLDGVPKYSCVGRSVDASVVYGTQSVRDSAYTTTTRSRRIATVGSNFLISPYNTGLDLGPILSEEDLEEGRLGGITQTQSSFSRVAC